MTITPGSLRESALVVRVSIHRWDPKRSDPRAAEIVKRETNGHGDVGEWRKWRVPKSEVDPIRKAADSARTYNYANTLPWQDGGFRLLAVAMFDDYMGRIGEYRQTYLDQVAAFLDRYPRLIEQAATRLGTLYDASDYPSREDLSARFDFRVQVSEISDTPDLRSDRLSPQVLAQLRDDMRRDIEAASLGAQRELWSRMFEIAKRLSETLGEEDKVFRDSLVTRSEEILTRLGALNVFSDPEIERVRADLRGILTDDETGRTIDPERFRTRNSKKPDGERTRAAQQAGATMREVAGILKRFGI